MDEELPGYTVEKRWEDSNQEIFELKNSNGDKFFARALKKRDFNEDTVRECYDQLHQIRNHPNIIKMKEIRTTKNQIFIISKLCEGKALKNKEFFTEEEALNVVKQIIEGLMHLHQNGEAYGNLSPSDIFINNDGNVEMVDYGLVNMLEKSTWISSGRSSTFLKSSTLGYVAPEIFHASISQASKWRNKDSDIYSLGKVIKVIMSKTSEGLIQTKLSALATYMSKQNKRDRMQLHDVTTELEEIEANVIKANAANKNPDPVNQESGKTTDGNISESKSGPKAEQNDKAETPDNKTSGATAVENDREKNINSEKVFKTETKDDLTNVKKENVSKSENKGNKSNTFPEAPGKDNSQIQKGGPDNNKSTESKQSPKPSAETNEQTKKLLKESSVTPQSNNLTKAGKNSSAEPSFLRKNLSKQDPPTKIIPQKKDLPKAGKNIPADPISLSKNPSKKDPPTKIIPQKKDLPEAGKNIPANQSPKPVVPIPPTKNVPKSSSKISNPTAKSKIQQKSNSQPDSNFPSQKSSDPFEGCSKCRKSIIWYKVLFIFLLGVCVGFYLAAPEIFSEIYLFCMEKIKRGEFKDVFNHYWKGKDMK